MIYEGVVLRDVKVNEGYATTDKALVTYLQSEIPFNRFALSSLVG